MKMGNLWSLERNILPRLIQRSALGLLEIIKWVHELDLDIVNFEVDSNSIALNLDVRVWQDYQGM